MKITLTSNKTSVTIEREDDSIEATLDSFISCLAILDYELQEIKDAIIKSGVILKNNHNEPNQNLSTI